MPVSFASVPTDQTAEKLDELARHGWRVLRPLLLESGVYLLAKDSDEPIAEQTLERELRTIMGSYYINIAAPGSPRKLDYLPSTPSDRQRQILAEHVAHGWRITPEGEALSRNELPPAAASPDPDVIEEGAATIAIRETDSREVPKPGDQRPRKSPSN